MWSLYLWSLYVWSWSRSILSWDFCIRFMIRSWKLWRGSRRSIRREHRSVSWRSSWKSSSASWQPRSAVRKGCRSWKLHLPKKGLLQIWWKNHPVLRKRQPNRKGKRLPGQLEMIPGQIPGWECVEITRPGAEEEKTWILQAFLQGQIYLKIEIPRKAGNLWIRNFL